MMVHETGRAAAMIDGWSSELPHGVILVVDDQEPNRVLLHDLLELDGHHVFDAADGPTALALAFERDPDVVLLDVSMPGMDGFEVCRRLRADSRTAATPVLLVTALDQRESRITGMAAGADDYLVKPIDRGEVSLRVRNAVRMRMMHRMVLEQYDTLRRLEGMRDELVAMLAHDLRSPLTGLRGYLELIQEDALRQASSGMAGMLAEAMHAVDQLNRMISDMLDVSRMETEALPLAIAPTDLRAVAGGAIIALGPRPAYHAVPIVIDVNADPVLVPCDARLIQRVMINLLANAVRFSPADVPVEITTRTDPAHGGSGGEGGGGIMRGDDRGQGGPSLEGRGDEGGGVRREACAGALVEVRDRGPGIPSAEQQRIFEKFAQLGETRPRTSGLGLTFCRMVVERHGGTIGVRSVVGEGSVFWFRLPGEPGAASPGQAAAISP